MFRSTRIPILGLAAAPLASTLVVASNGDDAAPGTVDRPLRTIQRAVDMARPGDTAPIRGGKYAPARNIQILNLDSCLNRDPCKNGESADGLAIKEGSGTGNVVRGARLWDNVDDGSSAGGGNSWNLGGTWNDSSLRSTDPTTITGHRTSDGTIPHTNFLVPLSSVDVGARF